MGRLVTPISKEEFDKLPKWQQWINNHWIVTIIGFLLVVSTVVVLIRMMQ